MVAPPSTSLESVPHPILSNFEIRGLLVFLEHANFPRLVATMESDDERQCMLEDLLWLNGSSQPSTLLYLCAVGKLCILLFNLIQK
jgi:hypothetical protein